MSSHAATTSRKFASLCAFALALLIPFGGATQAASFKTLYSFSGGSDGGVPYTGVITDGHSVFGATYIGGDTNCIPLWGCGVIFKIDRHGHETVLHTFHDDGSDGLFPASNLVLDGDGNLYGTTAAGGANSVGTVFKIAKNGRETVLYSFKDESDGAFPQSVLIKDSDGNLYGVTLEGGDPTCNCGTVFKLSPDGVHSVLHAFKGGSDGNGPNGLVLDKLNNLYGTTWTGGSGSCVTISCGTVFEIKSNGKEKIVYAFKSVHDGMNPQGSLSLDDAGNLWGVASGGGPGCGCNGTVFQITPDGKKKTRFAFPGGVSGSSPTSVIAAKSGDLFGTTLNGGTDNKGVIFKLPKQGDEVVLWSFTGGDDGASPWGRLFEDDKDHLYGTASAGNGTGCYSGAGCGTVFELTHVQKQ
jgi:uncharacterized repeat protein (TIGR03803 family)